MNERELLIEKYQTEKTTKIIADESNMGSMVISDLRSIGITVVPQNFHSAARKKLLITLRNVIEGKGIRIPRDREDHRAIKLIDTLTEQLMGFTRRLTSYVANLVCRLLFGKLIYDYTGNFRVYSRKCAERIVNSANCKGFDWVVEAIFVARKHGFTVEEVPIAFRDRDNGKTKLKPLDVASWALFMAKKVFYRFTAPAGLTK